MLHCDSLKSSNLFCLFLNSVYANKFNNLKKWGHLFRVEFWFRYVSSRYFQNGDKIYFNLLPSLLLYYLQ